ncbi:hypothetical protein [Aquimarina algiphila]|uniref:Uncharacterized protein n=1 Tax=Aquimarina algiphila TaxID=2047982 RepID=A0A554VH45_9FLAO|nr:hypothetical protein [Aquimarina algiphila]TSE06762.1 hypothetical protein FOF46_18270 [Aquimarina algiphila]
MNCDLNQVRPLHGDCQFINDKLNCVFSIHGRNYLFIEDELIVLHSDHSIQYFCGERKQKSWIKIFDKENLIFDLEYINPIQEPYIDFVSGYEDWEIVNWAYHLAKYINQIRDNPQAILFFNTDQGKEV